jgi:hypothetical protein
MVGRTVQGVAEQVSGQGGPGDQVVERRHLVPHDRAPPSARFVQHGGHGLKPHPELLHGLDERQAAKLVRPVHPPPVTAGGRLDEPALLVVPQGRGVEAEPARRLTDGNEFHATI